MPRIPSASPPSRRAVDTGDYDVARGAGADVVLERWRRAERVATDRLHFDRPGHARLTAALRAALARAAPLG